MSELTREVLARLAAPLPEGAVEYLPRATSNGRALALAYADARAVMTRLDEVCGPANWSFEYDLLAPNGKMVKGRLTVFGVTKCDAGEADREEEPLKSAVSDALKRCAVHFGIARYLYALPAIWAPYDAQKKQWTEPPRHKPQDLQRAVHLALGEIAALVPSAGAPPSQAFHARQQAPPVQVPRGATSTPPPQSRPESSGDARAQVVERVVQASETQTAMGEHAGSGAAPWPAVPCCWNECKRPVERKQEQEFSVSGWGAVLCSSCRKEAAQAGYGPGGRKIETAPSGTALGKL